MNPLVFSIVTDTDFAFDPWLFAFGLSLVVVFGFGTMILAIILEIRDWWRGRRRKD